MKKILTTIFIFLFFVSTASAYTFTKDLYIGSQNTEVKELQKFLNNYSLVTQISPFGAGSLNNETDYFGQLTKTALRKFQDLMEISPSTGYFGPKTRNKVNELISNGNSFDQNELFENKPQIYSISPDQGTAGTEITIKGSGFKDENDIIITFEALDRFEGIKSNKSGTEITFTIESSAQEKFDEQVEDFSDAKVDRILEQMVQLPLAVSVKNEDGSSNFKIFTLEFK